MIDIHSLIVVIALGLSTRVRAATFAPAKLGCHNAQALNVNPAYYTAEFNDPIACANYCASGTGGTPTEFSYYNTNNPDNGDETVCICSDDAASSTIYTAFDQYNTCEDGQYEGYRTSSTFYQFRNCHSTINNPDDTLTETVSCSTPSRCFDWCASYARAHYQPTSNGDFACACGSDQTGTETDDEQTCATNVFYSFYHDDIAQASQLSRRNLRERLARAKSKKSNVCPKGKIACKIARTDGYECIDTSTELESCGGCTHGAYMDDSALLGTDCSAIPGVALGASTCLNGKCQIGGCKNGWTLSANSTSCIRALRLPVARKPKTKRGSWHLHESR